MGVRPFVPPLVPIFHLVHNEEPERGPPFASSFEVRVVKAWKRGAQRMPRWTPREGARGGVL